MSGTRESPEVKLARMAKDLNENLARKGLILIAKPEVDHYLKMTRDELRSLPPEELEAVDYEIARYAYYLQTVMNDYLTKMNICRGEIEKAVGMNLGQYGNVYGRDEKWIAAIADDEYATAWRELEQKAFRSFQSLEYLPNRLAEITKAVINIQQERRRLGHGKV